ncbi:MAG TPA: cytochrome C, partial [Phycisphaerales bacterium]|nr:cytochrome C [Phycisphaerales bacterium]
MRAIWAGIIGVFVIAVLLRSAVAASIIGTPHDLSPMGEEDACHYCHTPHGALAGTPLWNHELSTAVYQIYQSSSLDAEPGQPTG